MAKKYKLKEDVFPKEKNYLGLGWANWVNLKNGKVVELENIPKEAKDFLEEVKSEKIKKVKVEVK